MKQKNKALAETAPLLARQFGPETARAVLDLAAKKIRTLCRENPEEVKAAGAVATGDLYPAIGLYTALQQTGVSPGEALDFMDRSWSARAEKNAASLRRLMRLPGLYRLYPALFKLVAKRQFGEKAGFRAVFYPTERTRVKFDMTRCLYCAVCRREGCPELTPCFCHTDDVNNGHLHPRLCWHRTQIMGDGGDVCDFDLYVKQ